MIRESARTAAAPDAAAFNAADVASNRASVSIHLIAWAQLSNPPVGAGLSAEQVVSGTLTLDDCVSLMATLALTGTPILTTTIDAAGTPSLTCGGVMTGTLPLPPTATPTETPTATPTETPTVTPTETPTATPTETPTVTPTETPTETPTATPAETPTSTPTETPTEAPTETPTEAPIAAPVPSEAAFITDTVAVTDTAQVTGTAPVTDTAAVTDGTGLTETADITLTATVTPTPGPYAATAPSLRTIPGHGIPGQSWQTINPGYKQQTNFPVRGFSTYYNPGIMEEVVAYRMRVGDITPCPECIGEVALIRAGDINRRIWLQLDDSTVEGPFLVTDCAHTWDVAPLVGRGWGVDLDYATARRWGFNMRVVTILAEPPPEWTQDASLAAATGALVATEVMTDAIATTSTPVLSATASLAATDPATRTVAGG